KEHFKEIDKKITGNIRFGDGSYIEIKGKGSILLECKNKDQRAISQQAKYISKTTLDLIYGDLCRPISPPTPSEDVTPYEALKGREANLQHIRIFGCIAYAKTEDKGKVYMLRKAYMDSDKLHVLVAGTSKKEIESFKYQMQEQFEMSDLGLLAYYLGIEVLRYIKGTKDYGITYGHDGNKIQGYSENSYGVNTQEGKGTTGIVFYFGNSPITWSTQKQGTVIPILRVGLALAEHASSMLPATKTYHLGGTIVAAIDLLRERGVDNQHIKLHLCNSPISDVIGAKSLGHDWKTSEEYTKKDRYSKNMTRVRSLELDVKIWEPSVITFQSLGNGFVNLIWEKSLTRRPMKSDKSRESFVKPDCDDHISTKEKFIHANVFYVSIFRKRC
nr:ribonuclease H-like domain, reverse transcriptase, RNA-dependent DNA polymerase [Tanacetum cinerariifolium]